MAAGPANAGQGAAVTASGRHKMRLAVAFGMTSTLMIAEVIAGLWTGSLALLADAAHMLTDAGGLALGLIAIRFAEKPATPQKTFGYVRAEVLSALANAVVLLLLTVYILFEAYQRFFDPPEIVAGPMLAVAVIGLIVNLVSMKLLASGASESLNIKGAYFEVLSDMLGSLAVIIAASIVLLTGWRLVDPIIGAAIGLFIVPRTWSLLSQAVHILLEGTPPNVDVSLLSNRLRSIPGVTDVHDLHVWTLTSGLDAVSGHLVVSDWAQADPILALASRILSEEFGLKHSTLQMESPALQGSRGHDLPV